MKFDLSRIVFVSLAALLLSGIVVSQDREDRDAVAAALGNSYVVSAKAGGVNYVEGDVTIKKSDGTSFRLTTGRFVEVGDVVTTGETGRAEILMNPGSFIRLNHRSSFQFLSTSLSDLNVQMNRGTAMFEVFASHDFKVRIKAADAKYYLVKSGIYRLDLFSNGGARLEVWSGRAQAGNTLANELKKGRAAYVIDDSVSVSKFKRDKDEFETWSKARAKTIAKANKKLSVRPLGNSVISSFQNNAWDCYSSVGLWVYNRRFGSYSFLPFGNGWRSPYGYRLGTTTSLCYYPNYYRRYRRNRGSGGNGGGGNGTAVVPKENVERGNRIETPPFQRMQQTRSVKRSRVWRRSGGGSSSGGGSGSKSVKRSAPSKPASSSSSTKVKSKQ